MSEPDEFDDYLDEAMEDPEFARAYAAAAARIERRERLAAAVDVAALVG